jgi:two-component system chemotaxis response regulator CheB
MIKVLIVEDSEVMREMIRLILTSDPEIEVIGTACDGKEASEFLDKYTPDVITMDLHMPRMNGFDATKIIMEKKPIPIIVVSASCQADDIEMTFRSLQAGAVSITEKPVGTWNPEYEEIARNLIQKVKTFSALKVVRRNSVLKSELKTISSLKSNFLNASDVEVIAIGASTGGPPVIEKILSCLPGDFSIPVVLVQHMTPGFIQGFTQWLKKSSLLTIKLAQENESLIPGCVYIAPDHVHIKISANKNIIFTKDPPVHGGIRPAVSMLFESLAENMKKKSVGILLTGMGRDGAAELKKMKGSGSITIAQDEASCVVYGMPKEAVILGGASYVLPPEEIAQKIISLEQEQRKRKMKIS